MAVVTKFRRNYRAVRSKRGKRRAPRKVSVRPSKTLTRTVKKIVSSMQETKQAYTSSGNTLTMFNSGIDSVGDYIQILPSIAQSVADNGRVGDQIRGQNLNVKGFVRLNVNDVADSTRLPQVAVRLMVCSLKNKSNWSDVGSSAVPLTTLLRKGGTTTGFTGVLSDLHAPINRDVFTVHADKKFYLKQDYLNGIGASIPSQYVNQDISKAIKFFNISVKCKKLMKYDASISSGLYPTNFAPFLLLGYCYLDGSSPDTVSTNLGLNYDSTFSYEDA